MLFIRDVQCFPIFHAVFGSKMALLMSSFILWQGVVNFCFWKIKVVLLFSLLPYTTSSILACYKYGRCKLKNTDA